jgi:hypothetical protein
MKIGVFHVNRIAGWLAAAAFMAICLSCVQNDKPSSSVPHTKPFSKMQKAPPPEKPTVMKTEPAGEDMRYVIRYQNTEFQIVAGEKGIFAFKVMPPDENAAWSDIWLDFYPQRTRPRTHEASEILGGDPRLEYVPEDIRKYALFARELALKAAPQEPQVGEDSLKPRGYKMKIAGLRLSPAAANEMSIFGRLDRMHIVQDTKLPARPLPEKVTELGFIRFGDGVSQLGYTPEATWARLRMAIRTFETGLLAIKRGGRIVCVIDFSKIDAASKNLEAVFTVDNGRLNYMRFGQTKAGEEKVIPQEFREDAGLLLAVLDNQLYNPPEEFRKELTTALLLLNTKKSADTFGLLAERKGGIEDILAGIGVSQK